MTVTAADTVRWLHEEGLARLAAIEHRGRAVPVYTIDIADGTVTIHPAAGADAEATALAADDLPFPAGTRRRLVVVGVTNGGAVLVLDLAALTAVSINGDRPEQVARAWVLQLLLEPEVLVTTNSATLDVPAGRRCRQSYLPGVAATVFIVDDGRPPSTTVTVNSDDDPPHRLEVTASGTGELYLSARYWSLRTVQGIDDITWTVLKDDLAEAPGVPTSGVQPSNQLKLQPAQRAPEE